MQRRSTRTRLKPSKKRRTTATKKACQVLKARLENAVSATSPNTGINGKGGKTTNFVIPEWMFEREMKEAHHKTN